MNGKHSEVSPEDLWVLLEQLKNVPREEMDDNLLATLTELESEAKQMLEEHWEHAAARVRLTPAQWDFMKATTLYSQIAIFAANQIGKTFGSCVLYAWDALGEYPETVPVILGTRPRDFKRWRLKEGQWFEWGLELRAGGVHVPVKRLMERRPLIVQRLVGNPLLWASSYSGEKVKETMQQVLVGRFLEGVRADTPPLIPPDRIRAYSRAAGGVQGLLESFTVDREDGGLSEVVFKFASKGVQGYTGAAIDRGWADEIHPMAVIMEMVPRTTRTGGTTIVTYTASDGETELSQFFQDPLQHEARKTYFEVTLYDATFYTPERHKEIADSYPAYQRHARVMGKVARGEGLVLPYSRGSLECDPFEIPQWWEHGAGMDFGRGGETGHPTAGVLVSRNPITGEYVIWAEYKSMEPSYLVNGAALLRMCKPWGSSGPCIPMHWPHDGNKMDPKTSTTTVQDYAECGLTMWEMSSRYVDDVGGGQGDGAFLTEFQTEIKLGKLRVFNTLSKWFEEQQAWHYKDGKIIDRKDDLMKATKTAWMMRRYWRPMDTEGVLCDSYEIRAPW